MKKTEREIYAEARYKFIQNRFAVCEDDVLLKELEDLEGFLAEMQYHRNNNESFATLQTISEDILLPGDV